MYILLYIIIYSQVVSDSLFYPYNCIQHNGDGSLEHTYFIEARTQNMTENCALLSCYAASSGNF